MEKRYGKKVTNKCTICGRSGLKKSEMHHIIGRTFINERATKNELRYLSKGLKKPVPKNLDDLRKSLINKLPSNITEMCLKCHGMTDSHVAWYDNWVAKQTGKKPTAPKRTNKEWAERGKQISRRKRSSKQQCKGIAKTTGERCSHRKKPTWKGDYCPQHESQDPANITATEVPGLYDEGRFDEEQEIELAEIHRFGKKPDSYTEKVFLNWSDEWKRHWLYSKK
jgi:uncharacterized short protein YbdD (DUF466 family)